MKKAIAILLSVCITVMISFSLPVMADVATVVYLDSVVVSNNNTATLSIRVKNNTGIGGLVASLEYNNDVLSIESIENGDMFSGFAYDKNLVWDNASNVSTDGVLATLIFKIKDDAPLGKYPIKVIIRSAVDEKIDTVYVFGEEGIISITDGFMLGDFDKDESITVADALAALRIAAKLVSEDAEAVLIGDIDGDSHVTVADALAILRVAAKLVDSL